MGALLIDPAHHSPSPWPHPLFSLAQSQETPGNPATSDTNPKIIRCTQMDHMDGAREGKFLQTGSL